MPAHPEWVFPPPEGKKHIVEWFNKNVFVFKVCCVVFFFCNVAAHTSTVCKSSKHQSAFLFWLWIWLMSILPLTERWCRWWVCRTGRPQLWFSKLKLTTNLPTHRWQGTRYRAATSPVCLRPVSWPQVFSTKRLTCLDERSVMPLMRCPSFEAEESFAEPGWESSDRRLGRAVRVFSTTSLILSARIRPRQLLIPRHGVTHLSMPATPWRDEHSCLLNAPKHLILAGRSHCFGLADWMRRS